MKDALINLSICLSDIPKERIKVSEKNGKKYLNVTIQGRKEPDEYGNNVYATVSHTKEERETAKEQGVELEKVFIGQGRHIVFNGSASPAAVEQMQGMSADQDDLPF